jgi:Cu-Zn family superoxide dismutase
MINIKENPVAYAIIKGSKKHPDLKGRAAFYDTYGGTVVVVSVCGLPKGDDQNSRGFHGFHIHEGGSCTGNEQKEFADAKGHYNPSDTPHPQHAGDLPPLLGGGETAWMAVYTNRFYPEEVIGRTVIIHENADDFHSQPSGDAGEMIACGEIAAWSPEVC